MRRLVVALGLITLTTSALAADYEVPTLRGSSPFVAAPPRYTAWEGFYIGGQVGYGSSVFDFQRATQSLIAFGLRELAIENQGHVSDFAVLGTKSIQGASFGGFIGYNLQFDDVVIGVDANYSFTSLSATAPNSPIGVRTSASGTTYDVGISGAASMKIIDYAALRLRGGYVVYDFLPYATFGIVAGRADLSRSATCFCVQDPDGPARLDFTFTESESKKNAFIYGLSGGLGIDYMVSQNLFVRGEYEYVKFFDIWSIRTQLHTGRVGAGFKF